MSITVAEWLAACPVTDEAPAVERDPFALLARQYRERADLSCNELARAVGVDPSYVSRWERGERETPRRRVVLAVCEALRLDADDTDRLLVCGGYAPAWLIDVHDLPRLRQVAGHLRALAALLPSFGLGAVHDG